MSVIGPQLRGSHFLDRVWRATDFNTFAEVFSRLDGLDIETFFENPGRVKARALGNPWLSVKVAAALAADRMKRVL